MPGPQLVTYKLCGQKAVLSPHPPSFHFLICKMGMLIRLGRNKRACGTGNRARQMGRARAVTVTALYLGKQPQQQLPEVTFHA